MQAMCHTPGTIILGTPFSKDNDGYATEGHALAYYAFKTPEDVLKTTSIYDKVQRPAVSENARPRTVVGGKYTLQMAEDDFARSAAIVAEQAKELEEYENEFYK